MAESVAVICEIAAFLLQGYCLQYFFGSFLERRRLVRRAGTVLIPLCYGAVKAVSFWLIPSSGKSTDGFYRMLLQCAILPVFIFCFYRAAKTVTVFLVTTFLAVNEISFFIGYMAMSLSTSVLELETLFFTRGYISADYFEQLLRFTAALLQALCCIFWILILRFSLWKVVKLFREKDYRMHRTELLFILAPGLAGFLLCVLLRVIMVTVQDGMPALLYDRYPVLRVVIPAILLLSLLSILYGVKLFQDMILLGRERNSRIILEQQIDNMQEHMGEMERLYAGVRSLRHDMKNTLAILVELSAAKKDTEEEFADYLAELNRSFDRLEFRFRTGNAVADALLSMKYHEMNRWFPAESMDFQAEDLLFPEDLAIQSYDIGVILGNALDNAIEACRNLAELKPQAKPFIRLSSFRRGKYFFLEIQNSFDGELKKDSRSEFPETRKTDKQIHGIGFANMKKTAEKYDGAVDFSVEGNPVSMENTTGYAIFTLSVMLKNQRSVVP